MTLQRPADEVARLGDEIYERDIRSQIEADHRGEYLAIDVNTGCWGLSDDLLEARTQLDHLVSDIDAGNVWCVRVGFRTLHNFGGRPWRTGG